MDRHNEESGCYEGLSDVRCANCGEQIPYDCLKFCKQDNGTYICPACLHDIDAEKLREEMGRD